MFNFSDDIVIAIITSLALLVGAVLGFAFKLFTGESKASVRKTMTDAIVNDAGASNQYMEAAKSAAEMLQELQKKVTALEKHDVTKDDLIRKLTERVECLEQEKIEWQKERDQLLKTITILQEKTKSGKGLAMK